MKLSLRPDLQAIADWVPIQADVLDIGCGEGDLLAYLRDHKQVRGRGLELLPANVNHCLGRGLSVVQGDASSDLAFYPSQAFDVVILSQTLQTLQNPKVVLEHLVRLGRRAIVSVPNFGHWKNRFYLALFGRMPVTKTLSYEWYDTPNIHFCTIADFVRLCDRLGLVIERCVYVTHQGEPATFRRFSWLANWWGEQGIFLIRRNEELAKNS